ncbi:MAG: hypothetical protein M3129_06230, partial [Thermoproteota archaeon]|nr:hypothetical protein [Thermoproteota archaeon]
AQICNSGGSGDVGGSRSFRGLPVVRRVSGIADATGRAPACVRGPQRPPQCARRRSRRAAK